MTDKKESSTYNPTVIPFQKDGITSNVISVAFDSSSNFIVLEGNLSDGWEAYGTFSTFEEASAYADTLQNMAWIMELKNAEIPKKPNLA